MCVCLLVCGGQRNIDIWFCLKTLSHGFSNIGTTDMAVDQSQTTSKKVMWPCPTSRFKRTSNPAFSPKTFFSGFSIRQLRIQVLFSQGRCKGYMQPTPHFRGEENIEIWFFLHILSEDFFDAENSDPGPVLWETLLLVLIWVIISFHKLTYILASSGQRWRWEELGNLSRVSISDLLSVT